MNWKLLLASVFVCGLLFGAVSYAAVSSIVKVRNVGTIRAVGVEVYANESLEQILHEVSWGTLNPGEYKSVTAWIKNTGNDAQKLILWTEGWEPVEAQNSISLSWDYDNEWIDPGAAVAVAFTLSVDVEISGVESFCFDIWIKGVA